MGIVDYTSRLAADVLKTSYLRDRSESRIYFALVWGLVLLGCAILLAGFDQPLPLLVISACVGGLMMFIYSMLLLVLNRRVLPPQIRPRVVPRGGAGLGGPALRRLLGADHLAAGRQADRLAGAVADRPGMRPNVG